jgi:uncharacterized protein (PEP-CTERM system associated)
MWGRNGNGARARTPNNQRHSVWLAGLLASACWAMAGVACADPTAAATPAPPPTTGNEAVMAANPAQELKPANTPPFFLTPFVGIEEILTDNVRFTSKNRQWDAVTRAMIGLNGEVNDGPAVASFTSLLSYDAYARNTKLNGWSFEGFGNGSVSLVKNLLSVDAVGTVVNGNVSAFGTPAIDRSGVGGRTQLAAYSIGPHLKSTVGSIADVEAVARWNQVFYTAANGSTVNNLPSNSNIVQVGGVADTGTRLSRLEFIASALYESDNHGFHAADGIQTVFVRVAPDFRLIGRAGYDSVFVPFVADVGAPLLSAGVEWTPNAQSRLTIEGGERYDRPTWAATAFIQLSGRIYLTADYYEVLEPDQVYFLNSFLDFVQTSNLLPQPNFQTSFSINGNLYNKASFNQGANAHLVYTWPRQTADVYVGWLDRDFLKPAVHDRTLVGGATYSRQLRPDLALRLDANYTRTYSSPLFGANEVFGGAAELVYNVNSTVDLNSGYALSYQTQFTNPVRTIYENVLYIALRKRF